MRSRTSTVLALVAALVLSIMPVAGAQTSGDDSSEGQSLELQAFNDTAGHIFENAIDWLAAEGITQGCNPPANNLFCPNDNVTRGQMAIFLSRAFNLPAEGSDYFSDDTGKVYESAANRLFEAGLTVGCDTSPRRYCGDDNISRGEMAVFLARALGLPPTTENPFSDDNGSIFENGINKIAAVGITVGCTSTTFCPDEFVTRGQMAAFIKRSLSETAVCAGITDVSEAQCTALIAFYESTNGTAWLNNTGWLLGSPCDGWFGVTCVGANVTSLVLEDNNLTGSIPAEIGALTGLTLLDIDGNNFTGGIPAQIGNLVNLTGLDLSSSNLSGPIPAQIGKLTNLVTADLKKNLLSGPLPPQIGNMTSLQELQLFENNLTGEIPEELGQLTALDTLDLSFNSLSDPIPAELGGAVALEHLDLSVNNLNGSIPSEIGSLLALTDLDLSENSLSGDIPTEIDELVGLVGVGSLQVCGNNGLTIPAADMNLLNFVSSRDPAWDAAACPP